MADITLHGNPCHTSGELPAVGTQAPAFTLVSGDLQDVHLGDFAGRKKLLNIVPSLDTPVCAVSTRKFNEHAANLANTAVLVVSADLPFAQARFCEVEGIKGVQSLSTMRGNFARDYGVEITDGPLAGITGRAVVVLDEHDQVRYTQLVTEIGDEPDYDAALAALG